MLRDSLQRIDCMLISIMDKDPNEVTLRCQLTLHGFIEMNVHKIFYLTYVKLKVHNK